MNPWIILVILAAWAASLVGVGKWQRADGAASVVAEYEKRDNAALVAANETIERLNREAREAERKHAGEIALIGESHAKERKALEDRRRRDVAAARDGAIELRVPGACAPGGGGATHEAGAAAAGGDGAADAVLPRSVTADLLDLANEADAVVVQLTACQAVIIADRKVQGEGSGPTP